MYSYRTGWERNKKVRHRASRASAGPHWGSPTFAGHAVAHPNPPGLWHRKRRCWETLSLPWFGYWPGNGLGRTTSRTAWAREFAGPLEKGRVPW